MINGNSGFNAPIDVTMDMGSIGHSQTLNLGRYQGPYPRSFSCVLTTPQNTPTPVAGDVTVNGRSGQSLTEQTFTLEIKGGG